MIHKTILIVLTMLCFTSTGLPQQARPRLESGQKCNDPNGCDCSYISIDNGCTCEISFGTPIATGCPTPPVGGNPGRTAVIVVVAILLAAAIVIYWWRKKANKG